MTPLLLACSAPQCEGDQHLDLDGLCVADTGQPSPGHTGLGDDSDPADSGADTADTADSGADTADTADSGADTADTADTGPRPLVIDRFDLSGTVGSAAWYGLSVAPEGTAWAATSAGLLRFDPATGTSWLYGTGDGLYTSDPRAVLAHSDGTVWVGHHGDSSRQGEHLSPNADGTISVLGLVDFTETDEIAGVYRMREQPYGVGQGDVWMATNEGLCLWDADLDVFQEHAHPTHPHSYSRGVAFTPEGDTWNGDTYQLSRWRYSNDGDLSTSADLYDYWVPWPVEVEVPVYITDLDADGAVVWVASSVYGYARVDVASEPGASQTALFAEPASVLAIRAYGDVVLLGTAAGVYVHDVATGTAALTAEPLLLDVVQQVAVDDAGNAWFTVPGGLVRSTAAP